MNPLNPHSRKYAAARYHLDLATVNTAKGLEFSQVQRGNLLTSKEYAEVEAVGMLAVYMVHLAINKLDNDLENQARLIERARTLASEKLGQPLDAELT